MRRKGHFPQKDMVCPEKDELIETPILQEQSAYITDYNLRLNRGELVWITVPARHFDSI